MPGIERADSTSARLVLYRRAYSLDSICELS
jgi:hypothetical protein